MHYQDVSEQIYQKILGANRILAVSHANPDADAVASLLAFKIAFEVPGREITLTIGAGTVPETLAFLPGREHVRRVDQVNIEDFDLLVMVDCADEERAWPSGKELVGSARQRMPVINVDHHISNTRYGTIDLVDAEAAATCEILVLLFEDLGIAIDSKLATILLSGIQGDTLGLRTPSTTGRTLEASATLLRAGADLDTVVDYLFRMRPYSTLKLWAQALAAVKFTGQLIWTEVTPQMLEDADADESEAEGIVNFLAGTIGARAAAMLYRKSDGWRVSMRSLDEDVDVSELTGLFGGGGHSRAAGCSLTGDESLRDTFLETIAQRVAREPASVIANQ